MTSRSKPELEAENLLLKSRLRSNTLARICESLFKWAGISACAFFAYKAIGILAGKDTWADINLKLNGLQIDCGWAIRLAAVLLILGVVFGIVGIMYGVWEKRRREECIEEKSARIIFLEKLIDQKRTTSGLTTTGHSPPEG